MKKASDAIESQNNTQGATGTATTGNSAEENDESLVKELEDKKK